MVLNSDPHSKKTAFFLVLNGMKGNIYAHVVLLHL